jgi:hypothetical protein
MHTRSITIALSVFMACSVALGLAACSSDEDNGTSGAGATGGAGGGSGGSGATGSGGSGATGSGGTGTGGSGGGAPASIDCQGTTCTGLGPVAPCCAGAGDQCGIELPIGPGGCQLRDAPGEPDESCTEAFEARFDGGVGPGDGGTGDGGFGDAGFTITGCCRPDGTCGIQVPLLGCTDISQFGDSGAPITCTP